MIITKDVYNNYFITLLHLFESLISIDKNRCPKFKNKILYNLIYRMFNSLFLLFKLDLKLEIVPQNHQKAQIQINHPKEMFHLDLFHLN
mgnify:CR=1 FL=1